MLKPEPLYGFILANAVCRSSFTTAHSSEEPDCICLSILLCGLSLQMPATVAKVGSPFTASFSQMQFAVFHLLLLIRSEESGCIHFSIPRLSLQMTSTVAKAGTASTDSSAQMQFSVFDSQVLICLRSQAAPFFNPSPVPPSAQMTPAVAICGMVFSFANAVYCS